MKYVPTFGKVRVRRGIYYFEFYKDAMEFVLIHKLSSPRLRIVEYRLGFAIQKEISGDYYGPKDFTEGGKNAPL